MSLKPITGAGWLKDVNDNFAAIAPVDTVVGLGVLRVARFVFDTAGTDSAGVSNKTAAAHPTGVTLPIHAIVVGGFFDVNTAFDSAASTAEIAIHVVGANDVQTAAAVSGAPYSTVGRKAIVPKANTPESTSLKCTAASEITCTVTVQALTVGKLTGYLYYVEGIASA
jgi:hypothetical protein